MAYKGGVGQIKELLRIRINYQVSFIVSVTTRFITVRDSNVSTCIKRRTDVSVSLGYKTISTRIKIISGF